MDGWMDSCVLVEKDQNFFGEPDVSLLWLRVWESRTKTTPEKEFQTENEMVTLTRPFL